MSTTVLNYHFQKLRLGKYYLKSTAGIELAGYRDAILIKPLMIPTKIKQLQINVK